MALFFRIHVPDHEDARDWADDFWDTYGFDYDTERTKNGIVIAWACNDHTDEVRAAAWLEDALKEDGIRYTTFEADPDAFFGLDKN